MEDGKELLRKILKIDEVLQDEWLFFFTENMPRAAIVDPIREVIDELGRDIPEGERSQVGARETLMTEIVARIIDKERKNLRQVVNVTRVVLYTNLGRANLSDEVCESIMDVTRNYTNLGYDVKHGSRGSHHDHMEKILAKITGAEATMIVDSNMMATILCLSVLAKDKEAIVSRGELMEIGGSFRVSEAMEQSDTGPMDVETTNKAEPSNHLNTCREGEIGTPVEAHISNHRILDFTREVGLLEMVELNKKLNLLVICNIEDSLMADLTDCGVDEPAVLNALKTGIDVILFSRDKLLGEPQGGIITGKKEYTDKMRTRSPARASRIDKMMLAIMETTFFEYSDICQTQKTTPVLNIITTPAIELRDKAERPVGEVHKTTCHFTAEVEVCKDQAGDGSTPTVLLDEYAVTAQDRISVPEETKRLLRKEEILVIIKITHDRVYLDVGIVREDEFKYIIAAFTAMDSRRIEG